jgi:hypothetical protein
MLGFLFGLVLICSALGGDDASNKDFTIRPSVDDKVEVTLGNLVCSFEWKDCTGGSSEQWSIGLSTSA